MNDSKIEYIKKIINQTKPSEDFISTNILVSGPWGSGKTTLKNEVWKDFIKDSNYLIIDINLWFEDYDNLSEIVFLKLLNYGFVETDIFKQRENASRAIINKISNSIKPINFIKQCINEDKNYGFNEIKEKILNDNQLSIAMKELIEFILKNSNKSKIIFLFDELDRCDEKFVKKFFSNLKKLFNIKELVHILFVNIEYIDKIFTNIGKQEKFIDKYFNHIIKIEPDAVEAINNLYLEITNDNRKYSNKYDDSKQESPIFGLIRKTITYRDFQNSKRLLSIFFRNLDYIKKHYNVTIMKTSYNWNYYDDDIILFLLIFFICKKIQKFESIYELESIIEEFSIRKYFEFEKYQKSLNLWINDIQTKNNYSSLSNTDFNIRKIKDADKDFLYLFALQVKKTIYLYLQNPFFVLEEINDLSKNLELELLNNINTLLDLFNNDITNDKETNNA